MGKTLVLALAEPAAERVLEIELDEENGLWTLDLPLTALRPAAATPPPTCAVFGHDESRCSYRDL